MNIPINPFVRGYHDFHIQRVAVISYDDRCPVTYLPLHLSQSHLPDEQALYRRCIFNDSFVLITEGQDIAPELDALCGGAGTIQAALYSTHGDDNGVSTHIGDTYSEEAAREVVRQITFETGHFSRCWEISAAHVTEEVQGRGTARPAIRSLPHSWLPGDRSEADRHTLDERQPAARRRHHRGTVASGARGQGRSPVTGGYPASGSRGRHPLPDPGRRCSRAGRARAASGVDAC